MKMKAKQLESRLPLYKYMASLMVTKANYFNNFYF